MQTMHLGSSCYSTCSHHATSTLSCLYTQQQLYHSDYCCHTQCIPCIAPVRLELPLICCLPENMQHITSRTPLENANRGISRAVGETPLQLQSVRHPGRCSVGSLGPELFRVFGSEWSRSDSLKMRPLSHAHSSATDNSTELVMLYE